MTSDQEKAAEGVVATATANVIRLKSRASLLRSAPSYKPAAPQPARRIDPDSPESLLRHAWQLLPVRAKGAPLTRFMLFTRDTQASRPYMAELMPDLSMRVVDSRTGEVLAATAPLAPGRAGR